MLKLFWMGLFFAATLGAEEIKVAMAANVGNVADALKMAFARHRPQDTLTIVLGASGKLATQIEHGAPFMVFVSADTKFPEKLKQSGSAVSEPCVYASGALALLSVKGLAKDKGAAIVADDTIGKVAIANPKTAPYGTAAIEAMQALEVYEKAKSKFVQAENVTQAFQYATTAADVGFVALSSLKSGEGLKYQEGVHWVEVEPALYRPIDQAVVLLKAGEASAGAKAFVEFLCSLEAKAIFVRYGYK